MTNTTSSALETPLHDRVKVLRGGRWKWDGGPRPACMMVNHAKVGLQEFISHTKVKPNPMVEDKSSTSNHLNLEIGRRGEI